MTYMTRLLGTAAVAAALAAPAAAQTSPPGKPQMKPDAGKSDGEFLTRQAEGHHISSELVGLPVFHSDGKRYGKVSDLVLDDKGNLVGAVLSVGGFLSMGAKRIALPWNDIQIEHGTNARAVIDLSEEKLADAPDFKTATEIRQDQEDRQRREQQRQNSLQRTPSAGEMPGSALPGGM